jgi:putative ABC transport system substrate-binding protein
MRRRDFITLLGGAAAWPIEARAQQQTPVIGYLSARSSESDASMLVAFREGLGKMGFAEGRNLTIEYRFADGQYARLTALAADLALRRVAVIAFGGAGPASDEVWGLLRTSQIPVVFNIGDDPVQRGLVASFDHPGGTMTGISSLVSLLTTKNVSLLRQLLPDAKTVAVLFDLHESQVPLADAMAATAAVGLKMLTFHAGTDDELDSAFTALKPQGADALLVAVSPFFLTRARQIAALAARHRVPAIYVRREFADAGGLMSYGYRVADSYRQMGDYAGRLLKGAKPAELPVVQPARFELIINLKAARALGLTVPPTLLAIADDVIE